MEGTIAPEKFIINGQEYAPEEATQLIELGSKYKKMESDLNTSLDKVYPEYTRSRQQLKEYEEQLAEKDRKLEELQKKANPPEEIPADVKTVRQRAREAGLATEDYLKEQGYMTKAEVEEMLNSNQSQQKLAEAVLNKASDLEKTIDGSDGRVPFDTEAVLAYANQYQITDLEEAYDRMNAKGNAKWKEAQLLAEEKPGLTTLSKGGVKREPEKPKVTDDNFQQMWDELYSGTE